MQRNDDMTGNFENVNSTWDTIFLHIHTYSIIMNILPIRKMKEGFNMKKVLVCLLIAVSLSFAGCGKKSNTQNAGVSTEKTQVQQSGSEVQYYFPRAGQHPDQELIKVINSSKSNLDIAIYSLTKKEIVDAIVNAKKRGVNVRIISDKQESSTKAQSKELSILKRAGIPIKINSHSGLMHMKVTIADKSTVTTGSYNYTVAATNYNDEVLVILNSEKAAQDFEKEFETMWNDNSNFKSL